VNINATQIKVHALAAATILPAIVLYKFPPAAYSFYPRCPVFTYLHVECPGCGATRALAALLHGRLVDALHYNALLVLLLPFLIAFFAHSYISILRGQDLAWPRIPVPAVHFLLWATFAFAIFRNALPAL
jgi:hypothetical protein